MRRPFMFCSVLTITRCRPPPSSTREIWSLPRNVNGSLSRPFHRARYVELSDSGRAPITGSASQAPPARVDAPAMAVGEREPHACRRTVTYSFAAPLAIVPEKRSL
jgi:hypothetical protein